jgi:N-methylhydantoinase A
MSMDNSTLATERVSIDTGGTFTDVVLEHPAGVLSLFKTPTTPHDPIDGILTGLRAVASHRNIDLSEMLSRVGLIVHGTTRATNAVITGTTARTAFITTRGHPDILTFRMGGREDPFRHDREFPAPYVPRELTFEIDERVDWRGRVVRGLDEARVEQVARQLRERQVEAVGVCLLWSVINGDHERRVREILNAIAPAIEVTLSHELNPVVREYHRASAACIDASLKPLMSGYLSGLRKRLADAGFGGELLVASVGGGLVDPGELARAPIQSLNSGPALAPVAGRYYAEHEGSTSYAIVVDAGGTSFDVSVVRGGRIPRTRETWLGDRFVGHIIGFPSVDVRTTGSGGGSIARVDAGGLLSVGPQSAGADPGPACYGRGGQHATVTDAALVVGYLDARRLEQFGLSVDVGAASAAVERDVAEPLSMTCETAAEAVMRVLTEQMVHAVEEVTIQQGLDPRRAVLVAGGGAAGFNVVSIAARLGCARVLIPGSASALSATGGLLSERYVEFGAALHTTSDRFDLAGVNDLLRRLIARCRDSAAASRKSEELRIEVAAEVRYPGQVWELELPLGVTTFRDFEDVEEMRQAFHRLHEEIFAVHDPDSPVEIIGWRATGRLVAPSPDLELRPGDARLESESRLVYLGPLGWQEVPVLGEAKLREVHGPAILELTGTTVFLGPGAHATRSSAGSIVVIPASGSAQPRAVEQGMVPAA